MRSLFFFLLVAGSFAGSAMSQQAEPAATASGMQVERIETGTGVADRKIVGGADSFPADVGSVYCWTHVTGAKGDRSITHVWYQGEQERARVELPVQSTSWRTWSSKKIPPSWAGAWRVVVLDQAGAEIGRTSFAVGG